MGIDQRDHLDSRPTAEMARALATAVGIDPAHLVVESMRLTPWNSHHTALLTCELVFILSGSPAEVQAMVSVGEPLIQEPW